MDCYDPLIRSKTMRSVHSVDTTPEMVVRSFLHQHGFRFRLHTKNLPGHPDIVLPKYKTVVEVRGCFWHRHPGCKNATTPSSNITYWNAKFERNVKRDHENELRLKNLGWRVIVIWECELKSPDFLNAIPALILKSTDSL